MQEYGFSQTRILLYNNRISDYVLIRESTNQWKTRILVYFMRCIKAIALSAQLEFVLSFDFSYERYKQNWPR